MTKHGVSFSALAARHIETIQAWWIDDRPDAPEMFLDELQATVESIARRPMLGVRYPRSRVAETRRILLRRSQHHLYYSHDGERGVVVRAV